MPNIKSLSALRNYSDVLDEVDIGHPVFLTRNGQGKYAIIDINEFDSMKDALWGRLFEELDETRNRANREGFVSISDARLKVLGNG